MLYLAAMVTNFSMSGWSLGALVAWSCWSPARPAPQKNCSCRPSCVWLTSSCPPYRPRSRKRTGCSGDVDEQTDRTRDLQRPREVDDSETAG